MKRIIVYRGANCWIADHRHTPQAAEIQSLFGTFDLPLPFTPTADDETVRAFVQARYPDLSVALGRDARWRVTTER